MKIPIDQYESKLHGRVFGVFTMAMLLVTVIAWRLNAAFWKDIK